MKKSLFSLFFGSHPMALALFNLLVTHKQIAKESIKLAKLEQKRADSSNKVIDFKNNFKASKAELSNHWNIA